MNYFKLAKTNAKVHNISLTQNSKCQNSKFQNQIKIHNIGNLVDLLLSFVIPVLAHVLKRVYLYKR